MSISDDAITVLQSIWDGQEEWFANSYLDLLAKWREYALANPDAAINKGLPWQDDLTTLIERGTVEGASDMLSLFAAEAGLTGGTEAILATIADHYAQHAVQIAGDMDGSVSAAAKNTALLALKTGMSERDAAGILMQKYGSLGEARTRTIARTELTNGATLSRVGAFAAAGRTCFEYRAILDNATTRICHEMEGVVLDMLDPLARQMSPASHFRCRSMLVPAASGAVGAKAGRLRALLGAREAEFPGWQSRLAPTIETLMGVGA